MAGAGSAARREPLLLGTIGVVVGVVLAVVIFGGLGGSGPVGATSPPTTLPGQSPAPTTIAVASPSPSLGVTAAPATAAPTDVPTAPPATPEPTTPPETAPAIVAWDVPKLEDCTGTTGGMIHVSWSVQRASGVTISIDGPGIFNAYAGLTGEVDVPYGCDHNVLKHTYTLTTVGGTGQAATSTKTVRTRAPSIISFRMGEADCVAGGERFIGISMSYEIRAATGAELKRSGVVYSTYTAKTTDDIVMFDCAAESQLFRLTTTGGYGDEATEAIRVFNPLFQ